MGLPLSVVYRNLAHLHGAGVGWPEAIDAATGRHDPRWAAAREALARGAAVSDALAPLVPPVDLAGISAAEASGRMESILLSLAGRHEDLERVDRARRGDLAYPVFVAHLAALLMMVPDLFAGRVGAAMLWAAAVLVPVYAFFALSRAVRRAAERGDESAGRGLARLLRTRSGIEDADARALTALGWLSDAGVPPLSAVPLARRAGVGGRVSADLLSAETAVRAGHPISTAWRETPPAIASRLVNGEATGTLSKACFECARFLEESAATRRKVFSAALKPISILVIGAVVAARVISFWAGYYGRLGL